MRLSTFPSCGDVMMVMRCLARYSSASFSSFFPCSSLMVLLMIAKVQDVSRTSLTAVAMSILCLSAVRIKLVSRITVFILCRKEWAIFINHSNPFFSMEGELKARFEKYFTITSRALQKAKDAPENLDITDGTRKDFLDMVERYIHDSTHFASEGDLLNAFAAITYAHGWLDAGARIGLWDVHDPTLFPVDEKSSSQDRG